jgi:hypothetical protein
MDLKVIAQKQLVERYLLGRLTPPEAKFFEQVVRKSPQLAERMGLPDALRRTMQLLDETGTEWREQTPRFWHRPWIILALGAALLLVAVLAVTAWLGKHELAASYGRLKAEAERGQLFVPTRSAVLHLVPARHDEAVPTYPIGTRATPTLAELRIDVSYIHGNLFRVIVRRDDGTYWARFDNQLRDSNGELRLAFNSAAFTAGIYSVALEQVNLRGEGAPAGRLRLRIEPR